MGLEEQFKRHISKKIPLEIVNSDGEKDIFYFKKLDIEQLADMLDLTKKFDKDKIKNKDLDINDISKEDLLLIKSLLLDIVEKSYPDISKQDSSDFVNSNLEQLFELLDKLAPDISDGNAEKIKKALKK